MTSSSKSIDVTEIMREIRERVRQKHSTGLIPDRYGPALPSLLLDSVRASLSELRTSAENIDQLPPQPPTVRGSIGGVLSRLVRRLLFWQYAQAKSFQATVLRIFEQFCVSSESLASRIEEMDAEIRHGSSKVQRLSEHNEQLEMALSAASPTIQRLIEDTERLSTDNHRLRADFTSAQQHLTELSNALSSITQQITSANRTIEGIQKQCESVRDTGSQETRRIAEQLATLDRYSIITRRNVVLQEQRITAILNSVRKHPHAPPSDNKDNRDNTLAPDTMASLYLALEDAFRGSQQEIAERLSVYLPILEQAGVRRSEDLVIDIGCGRGEWLNILSRNSYKNKGCDANSSMVSSCRERGLEVVEQDAVQFLGSLQADSVSAITAFHVVEHLPLATMLELIDGSLRALRPGGVLILETPNPQNILVSSHNFYLDPTHRKPIPMLLLQFIVEARGFCDIRPMMLHPYAESMLVDGASDVAARFNEYFYGPQDYAIVAHKP